MGENVKRLQEDMRIVKATLETHTKYFEAIDARFTATDQRLAEMTVRLDVIREEMDRGFKAVLAAFAGLEARILRLEEGQA